LEDSRRALGHSRRQPRFTRRQARNRAGIHRFPPGEERGRAKNGGGAKNGVGFLKHFDTEGVLALIAPRPFLALTGDLDYGSPVDGIRVLEEKAGGVYRAVGAEDRFKSIVYQDIGHSYTPEMRAEMLAWFQRWLGNPKK